MKVLFKTFVYIFVDNCLKLNISIIFEEWLHSLDRIHIKKYTFLRFLRLTTYFKD